jgi:hypothetical protein
MKFSRPSLDPPKHEMAFFPNRTTSLASESSEFRRVLWTGLYSQVVLMTIPVDGEIGDEVSPFALPVLCAVQDYFCLLVDMALHSNVGLAEGKT